MISGPGPGLALNQDPSPARVRQGRPGTPLPVVADISGLTPCKESKQFAKREKQQLKKLESSLKLYAPDSAPTLAIKATMEKTKRRFDNYGK